VLVELLYTNICCFNNVDTTVVHHQRRQYKKFKAGKPAHITQERIDQLNALGFNWTPRGDLSAMAQPDEAAPDHAAAATMGKRSTDTGTATTESGNRKATETAIEVHATISAAVAAGTAATTSNTATIVSVEQPPTESTTTAAAAAAVLKEESDVELGDGTMVMAPEKNNDHDKDLDEKSPKRLKTSNDEFEPLSLEEI
jgi:hypothetical protein